MQYYGVHVYLSCHVTALDPLEVESQGVKKAVCRVQDTVGIQIPVWQRLGHQDVPVAAVYNA